MCCKSWNYGVYTAAASGTVKMGFFSDKKMNILFEKQNAFCVHCIRYRMFFLCVKHPSRKRFLKYFRHTMRRADELLCALQKSADSSMREMLSSWLQTRHCNMSIYATPSKSRSFVKSALPEVKCARCGNSNLEVYASALWQNVCVFTTSELYANVLQIVFLSLCIYYFQTDWDEYVLYLVAATIEILFKIYYSSG